VKRFFLPPFGGFVIVGVLLVSFLPIYLLSRHGHFVFALIYFLLWPLVLNILIGSTCEIAGFLSRRIGRDGQDK